MTNGITARKLALRLLAALSALCAALALAVLLPGDARTAHAAESGHAEHGADWAELSAEGGELAAGKYCLAADVKLTEDLLVSGEATLCLNGYILTGTGTGPVIMVESGADFTLCDCREGAADVANEINGVTYNSGAITGGSAELTVAVQAAGSSGGEETGGCRCRGGGHPVGGMRDSLQKGQKARSIKNLSVQISGRVRQIIRKTEPGRSSCPALCVKRRRGAVRRRGSESAGKPALTFSRLCGIIG